MLRFTSPVLGLWQRLVGVSSPYLSYVGAGRLAFIASVGFHGLLFLTMFLPRTEVRRPEVAEVVDLVSLTPQEEARLPSIEPLLPTDFPPLDDFAPQGSLPPLNVPGIEPPPFSFSPLPPLAPLPPLPPLEDLPPLDFGFSRFPPTLLPNVPLPPPIRIPMPENPDQIAVAPDLVTPRATPETADPDQQAEAPATDDQGAIAGLSRWVAQARASSNSNNVAVDFSGRITYAYPKEACPDRLEGQSTVAVLIDPNGQLVAAGAARSTGLLTQNPQLIRSSGYEFLDDVAIATVMNQNFAATGQYKALAYTLDFQYAPQVCGTDASAANGDAPPKDAPPSPSPAAQEPTAAPSPGSQEPAPEPDREAENSNGAENGTDNGNEVMPPTAPENE